LDQALDRGLRAPRRSKDAGDAERADRVMSATTWCLPSLRFTASVL
jgi:hypothetical protein